MATKKMNATTTSVIVPPPRHPATVRKMLTYLKEEDGDALITVVNQTTVFEDLQRIKHKTMITEDSVYSVEMLREWEHEEMFTNARQWCLYEALMRYLEVHHIQITASSCIAALNIVKEAVFYLAYSSLHDILFKRWLESCFEMFERRSGAALVTDRPE